MNKAKNSINVMWICSLIWFFSIDAGAQTQSQCPVPATTVIPTVSVSVSRNSKTGAYTYTYGISNSQRSPLDISTLTLIISSAPTVIGKGDWVTNFTPVMEESPSTFFWHFPVKGVRPGGTIRGLTFDSNLPPGPVRFLVDADSQPPAAVPDNTSDEPIPNCPGIYFDGPWVSTFATGLTVGPVGPSIVGAKIRIGRIEDARYRWQLSIPAHDTGKIKISVMGSEELDVSKIDLNSIRFGQGNAKPLSSKILPVKLDRDEDSNHDDEEKEWHHRTIKREYKNLQLDFKISDLGLKCNIDHALFLTGKVNGKDLFGGVKITPEMCKSLEHKEAKDSH